MQQVDTYKHKKESNFRLIGIRMEHCPDENLKIEVRRQQKSFYGHSEWIYFYKGFDIDAKSQKCKIADDAFADSIIYNTLFQTISISAIVGKNGTGKSTIVDMMIRVLNNLSAAILSEEDVYPAAAHLHYIDNVYASLAVCIKDVVKIITCKGRDLTINRLCKKKGAKRYTLDNEIKVLSSDKSKAKEPILTKNIDENLREELESLFYTAVYNYSLYAFNYRDYQQERTPLERLQALGTICKGEEDNYWLKGVFHKNDGYQTPIVINPMREDGQLKVQKENKLAKDRLLSLLFYKDENGNYPFRIINEKLEIVGINLKGNDKPKYGKAFVLKKFEIDKDSYLALNYDTIYKNILEAWSTKYNFTAEVSEEQDISTCNYVVYKTIKIAFNYKKYEMLGTWLESAEDCKSNIEEYVEQLFLDKSHITLKLRRALNFLAFYPIDGDYQLGHRTLVDLNDEYGMNQQSVWDDQEPDVTKNNYKQFEELLPPPTYDYDFDIVPVDKINRCAVAKYDVNDIIPFEGLSAGERQIAYTVSNVMYHLVNINSVREDYNEFNDNHNRDLHYSNVNILFDELELYFHPELQRLFVSYILKAIESGLFKNISGINILMVTHSPFVISDLPVSNVLFLTKDFKQTTEKTFGANIYEMLNQHFFLGQPIGAKAVGELSEIITLYHTKKSKRRKEQYIENRDRYHYVAGIVGDKYISSQLKIMLHEMDLEYEINLQEQLDEYRRKVKQLEKRMGV